MSCLPGDTPAAALPEHYALGAANSRPLFRNGHDDGSIHRRTAFEGTWGLPLLCRAGSSGCRSGQRRSIHPRCGPDVVVVFYVCYETGDSDDFVCLFGRRSLRLQRLARHRFASNGPATYPFGQANVRPIPQSPGRLALEAIDAQHLRLQTRPHSLRDKGTRTRESVATEKWVPMALPFLFAIPVGRTHSFLVCYANRGCGGPAPPGRYGQYGSMRSASRRSFFSCC